MKILIVYYFFPQFSFRNLHLGKYIVTVDGINIYVACVSWHFPLVLIWLFLWWFRVLAMFSTKLHLFWFSFVPSRAPICAKLRPNRSNSTLFSAMDGPQTSSIVRWTISKKRAQPFLPRLLWVENRPAINSRNVLEGVPDGRSWSSDGDGDRVYTRNPIFESVMGDLRQVKHNDFLHFLP